MQVEATFPGSNGQNLRDTGSPVEALTDPSSNTVEGLTKTPIKPSETRPFRIYFDHYPDDWNKEMPELKVTMVTGTKP